MRREWIKTRWFQLRERMVQRWDRLSELDLVTIDGNWNLLVTRLQVLYNADESQVENEIDRFLETVDE